MEALQVIAPLIGVVLGSAISGIGAYLRIRMERKRLIACAPSDLLEIRHHILGIEVVLREVKNRAPVSEEEAQLFRTHMNAIIPLDEDVHKRYDEAISLLSGIDPILAFKMRSKNKVSQFLDSIRNLSSSIGATPSQISTVESALRLAITPALDKAVLELASHHSLSTKHRVKKLVVSAGDVHPDLTKLLDKVTSTTLKESSSHDNTTAG